MLTQSTVGDLSVVVTNGTTRYIGPFTTDRFAQSDGTLWIELGGDQHDDHGPAEPGHGELGSLVMSPFLVYLQAPGGTVIGFSLPLSEHTEKQWRAGELIARA